MKGVAVALVLAAAASQQADAFLLAKLPTSKAQQGWLKRSSSLQQRQQGRYVRAVGFGCVCSGKECADVSNPDDVCVCLAQPAQSPPRHSAPTRPTNKSIDPHTRRPSTTQPQQLSVDPNALALEAPRGASGLLAAVLASTPLASSNLVKALPLVGGLVALALLAIKLPGVIAKGALLGCERDGPESSVACHGVHIHGN